MISFFLNGQATETACQNLLQLVHSMGLENKRFAVELNEMIIPKSRLENTLIQPKDRIEIIHAVGGG